MLIFEHFKVGNNAFFVLTEFGLGWVGLGAGRKSHRCGSRFKNLRGKLKSPCECFTSFFYGKRELDKRGLPIRVCRRKHIDRNEVIFVYYDV